MKTQVVRIVTLICAVLLGTVAASAQSTTTSEPFLRAKVPFAFVVGGVHLPAGEYRVYHPGNPYVVVIENNDGTARAMTFVRPSVISAGENDTKLLFNRYADQYFLAEIWTARDQEKHQCFKCRMEQTLIAQARTAATVIVAAKH